MRISDWSSDVCSSDLFVAHDPQRAIVPAQRRAVGGRGDDANLKLARQIAEFGVKAGRLTQQLGPGARVADFVGGGARILVGGNVDRRSVVSGKSVSGRVDLGGRRNIKKKTKEMYR